MLKTVKWVVLAFMALLIQTQFSCKYISLNVTVALVYYFGLRNLERVSTREYFGSKAEIQGALFGAVIGLIEDALTGPTVGPNLLGKGLTGFVTPVLFSDVVFRWTPFWGMIIITMFTFLDGVVTAGARTVFSDLHISFAHVLSSILIQAVFNIPFGITLKPKAVD